MVAKKNAKKVAKPAQKKAPAKPAAKAPAKAVKKAEVKAPAKPAAAKAPAKAPGKAPAKPAAKPVAKAPAKPVAKAAVQPAPKPVEKKEPAAAKPATKPVVKQASAAPVEKVEIKAAKQVEPTNGKMSAFVAKQKQRLLDLRDELVNSMYGVTRDTLRNAPEGSEASGSGMHQGDAGSDAYDRDFALSVLAKEQDALYEIEEALKRIDRGTYGVCEMSGRRIPQARLEAIPFARLTVECQAEWEKEHGNRRFRPSSEVGFGGGIYEEEEESESVSLDEEED